MPACPTAFIAQRNGNEVKLTWSGPSGCTFNAERGDGGWAANNISGLTVTDPNSPANSTYECVAVQGGVDSNPSHAGPV